MMKSRFLAFAGSLLVVLLATSAAAVDLDALRWQSANKTDTARWNFVSNLWHSGDLAVYISPVRGFALVAEGHEDLLRETYGDGEGLDELEVMTLGSTTEVAFLLSDINPEEGDTYTMVSAQCQKRTNPCKTGCVETTQPGDVRRSSKKDTNVVDPFGSCQRIDDHEGSCTQTYKKICDRQKYNDGICRNPIGATTVLDWYCDPS